MNVDNIKFKPLGAMLIVVGLLLFAFTYRDQRKLGPVFEKPEIAQGTVLERFTSPGKGEPEMMLRVQVEAQGSKRIIERQVDEDFWNAHDRGALVEVAYYGGQVSKGSIRGSSSKTLYLWLKTGGSGVLVLLGVLVLAYDRWRK